jgi:hypothetical protein
VNISNPSDDTPAVPGRFKPAGSSRIGRTPPIEQRPIRDCGHPGRPHSHGTRVAYVKDRCRCWACRAANTAHARTVRRDQAYSRWHPFVNADATRAHLETLRDAGLSSRQLAALTGLSRSHLRALTTEPPHAAISKIRAATAQKVLRVQPADAANLPSGRITSTGTRRRLEALIAIGWPPPALAADLDWGPSHLRRTMTARTVPIATGAAVRDLYDRLWHVPPPNRTPSEQKAVAAARRLAQTNRWSGPLAWDDIDHDPAPIFVQAVVNSSTQSDIDEVAIVRALAGDVRVRLSHAEQTEAIRRATHHGQSIHRIADALALSPRTVSRHRRAGTHTHHAR